MSLFTDLGAHVLRRSVLVGAMLMVLVAACNPGTDPPTTLPQNPDTTQAPETTQPSDTTQAPETTQPSDTTQAPDTTQASDTTVAGDEDSEKETPWWLLLLVLGALLILVVAFVARGSKKSVVVAPPPVSWKDNARAGYANARWLYDAMTEDLAVWRGNTVVDGASETGSAAATSLANTWQQLDGRMGDASDELYALESSAPDQRTASVAGETISALRALRTTVDARAESRVGYRAAESSDGNDTEVLKEARDREVRTSRNLAEARSALGEALTSLSAVV
jgi:hypothetical protein